MEIESIFLSQKLLDKLSKTVHDSVWFDFWMGFIAGTVLARPHKYSLDPFNKDFNTCNLEKLKYFHGNFNLLGNFFLILKSVNFGLKILNYCEFKIIYYKPNFYMNLCLKAIFFT